MRLAWSPDSRSLALNLQQRIIVWEGGVGTAPRELRFDDSLRISSSMFPNSPPSVEWSPQGDRLAFLAVSGLISQGTMVVERDSPVWRLPPTPAGLNRLPQPKIQRGGQYEIAWSPDGSQLASITERTVEVWNAISGAQVRAFNLPQGNAIRGRRQERWPLVAWSPAGAKLATCDRMNFVQVWDAATGDLFLQLDGGNSTHAKLALVAHGRSPRAGNGGERHRLGRNFRRPRFADAEWSGWELCLFFTRFGPRRDRHPGRANGNMAVAECPAEQRPGHRRSDAILCRVGAR